MSTRPGFTQQRVEPSLVVTMQEAARLLGGISTQTVRRLLRNGPLEKASYPGSGRVLITRASIERLATPASIAVTRPNHDVEEAGR